MRSVAKTLAVATLVSVGLAPAAQAQIKSFAPVTDAMLQGENANDWLMWRRTANGQAYSPLDQVNRDNVGDLELAWVRAIEGNLSEQGPLVHDGVMYLSHPTNTIQALDATTGAIIWEYRSEGARSRASRAIALYGSRIYFGSHQASLVALSARSGDVIWERETVDPAGSFRYSAGPIAGDGKIFAGMTCGGRSATSCFISGHSAETGEELWRRYAAAGPGDPIEHQNTWNDIAYEDRVKASVWLPGSYDPELNLTYWGTASPYPYPEIHKPGGGDGDMLYTNSLLALDADTGEMEWFFQMHPRDNWDSDHMMTPTLVDLDINGEIRRSVLAMGKPGILWSFDRANGELTWFTETIYQNMYLEIDSKLGVVSMNPEVIPTTVGQSVFVCPSMRGGKLYQTRAYSPDTQAMYVGVSNTCMNMVVVPLDVSRSGVNWTDIQHVPGGENVGKLAAYSATDGALLWEYEQRAAMGSPMATGGGLVFAGDLYRNFMAFNDETGELLWEAQANSPVSGYPITYAVDGRQYVAVSVGGSGGANALALLYPELDVAQGNGMLMVFALPE